MITMHESIESYCYEKKLQMPSHQAKNKLGSIIWEKIKKTFSSIEVNKIKVTESIVFEVNQYPDECAPIIRSVLEKYFFDKQKFYDEVQAERISKQKYLNYSVSKDKAKSFEDALKSLNMEVFKTGSHKDTVHYRLSYNYAKQLIELGMAFKIPKIKVSEPKLHETVS